jgi:hypothetical protein
MAKGANFAAIGKTWNGAERRDATTIRLYRWESTEFGEMLKDVVEAPVSYFSAEELDAMTPCLTDCPEYVERQGIESAFGKILTRYGFEFVPNPKETEGFDFTGWAVPNGNCPDSLKGRAWGVMLYSGVMAELVEDGYTVAACNKPEELSRLLNFLGLKEK